MYIIGMPGSGKTTVGRMLAEGLNYRWMDLDQFIEKVRTGETVFCCVTTDNKLLISRIRHKAF